MVGTQADFEYDCIAEVVFDEAEGFRKFFACVNEPGNVEKVKKDEELFTDGAKMRAVVVGECVVTTGA